MTNIMTNRSNFSSSSFNSNYRSNPKRNNRNNSGANFISDRLLSKLYVDRSSSGSVNLGANNYPVRQNNYTSVSVAVNAMNKPSLLSQSLFMNNHHPHHQYHPRQHHNRHQNQTQNQRVYPQHHRIQQTTLQPFLFVYLPFNPAVLPNFNLQSSTSSSPLQQGCQLQLSQQSMFQGNNLCMLNNR